MIKLHFFKEGIIRFSLPLEMYDEINWKMIKWIESFFLGFISKELQIW